MPLPVPLAGVDLTADVLTYMLPLVAIKPSDQSVTSSTVLVNDTALFLTFLASATYEVWIEGFWLPVNNSATPGLNYAFTAPAGATFTYRQSTATLTQVTTLVGNTGITAAQFGTYSPLSLHGTCVMSTTAGSLQFQFSQSTSSATSTTMKAGSFMVARRIA